MPEGRLSAAARRLGSARTTADQAAGGQTDGEQTGWKRSLAGQLKRGVVLDVGCGDGASSVRGAVGLDGSVDALRRAARAGVRAVHADVEAAWPIAPASVGTVCLFDVLEQVPDPRPLLAEAARVLAPGGVVLVALPNAAHLANRGAALAGRTTDFTDAAHHSGNVVSDHLHRFTLASGRRLLEDAGFTVTTRHDFFPTRLTVKGWRWAAPLLRLLRATRAPDRFPSLLASEFLWAATRAPAPGAPLPIRDVPPPAAYPVAKAHAGGAAVPAVGQWSDPDPRYRGYRRTLLGRVKLDHRVRVALGLLKKAPHGVLVDVGGGDGYVSARAAQRVRAERVLVLDVEAPPPLAKLRQPVEHRALAPGDPWPLDPASVDVVLSLETIEHLTDPDQLLEDAYRVLRPGGQLVLSTPRLDSGLVIASLMAGIQPPAVDASARRRYGSPVGEGRASGHLHLFTRRALREALTAHGFTIAAEDQARSSSSWRRARRATRRPRLTDLPVEMFFLFYDRVPWRKDVCVVRAVKP